MIHDQRWLGMFVGAMLTCGMAQAAIAGEYASPQVEGALRKLGRGLANVVTCPFELIRTPELIGRKEGFVSAVSVGLFHGAWRVVLRGVVGLFEVATFYAEIPHGYEPLLRPAFVWAHGDWAE